MDDPKPSPWPERIWKAILTVVGLYAATWLVLWLYIHFMFGSQPSCFTLPYDSVQTCAVGDDLHVTRATYRLWRFSDPNARTVATRVGTTVFTKLSESHEGSVRAQIGTRVIGAYMNSAAYDLFRDADQLIAYGCEVLDIHLAANEIGLPTLKVSCWMYA